MMNPILQEILEKETIQNEKGEPVKIHSGVPREVGAFLQELITELKPVTSLEVGLAYGVSALFICEALAQNGNSSAKHIVIDPHQLKEKDGWASVGLNNLNKAGYGNLLEFYAEPSHHILPELEKKGRKIEFAFIDGWHTFEYALVDFFLIDQILKVGGVVVFDDVNFPSIRKVCRYILSNYPYQVYKRASPFLPARSSIKRRFFNATVGRVLKTLDRRMGFLKPEVLKTDSELFLNSRAVALKKISNVKLNWDEHVPF